MSSDELLDLVDENDNIIGEIWKSKANTDPNVIHREVALLIYDDQNRVLIQKRSMKKKNDPGLWIISVAGHVPKGMTPLQAAHMELEEELGFNTKLRFINKYFLTYSFEKHFAYLYTGKYPKGAKITLDPRESDEWRFVTKSEFEGMKSISESLSYKTIMAFMEGKLKDL